MSTATKTTTTKRAKAPAVHVTLAMFDTRAPIYRVRRESVPIHGFAPLGPDDYVPSAMTPLRDAVAQFIAHLDGLRAPDRVTIGLLLDESGSMAGNREAVIAGVNEFVAGMRAVEAVDPASARKVLAVIVTDGLENSSREVDPQTLARSIAERERDGWTFIYLGANQDAWAVGEQTGFSGGASGQAVNFRATPAGTPTCAASSPTLRRGPQAPAARSPSTATRCSATSVHRLGVLLIQHQSRRAGRATPTLGRRSGRRRRRRSDDWLVGPLPVLRPAPATALPVRAVATATAAMPAASVPDRGRGGRPGTPSARGGLAERRSTMRGPSS